MISTKNYTPAESLDVIVRLPFPHPGQRYVQSGARRFNLLLAGRRWRKTTMCMTIAIEAALKKKTIVWGAPTYDQVRTAFEETERAVAGIAKFNKAEMTCALPTGGRILYRSLDSADNVRGKSADGVVIDEAPFCDERAWREILRPMLIDTGGWAWLIGTPKGRNWFYQEWIRAQDDKEWATFQAPTLGARIGASGIFREPHPLENPNIPFEELEKLWQSVQSKTFQQEILAEFIETDGGVFRNVRPCAIAERVNEPLVNHTYVAGLDWALSNDYTVLSIIDATDKALVYVDRFNGIDYSLQRERIKATCDRFGVRVVVAEENAMGKPNNDMLRRMGVKVRDFTTTATTKADIIEELAAAFERGAIKIINDPVLIGELEAYESERSTSGGVKYNAPPGMHDDMVMSAALCWSNVRQRFAYG